MKKGITYADSGVNIDKGNEFVDRIKDKVKETHLPGVIGGVGGFGGLFAPDFKQYQKPVLVSGTDGVGTKLKIAQLVNKHDIIGIDLVAMCVNDILAQGAKPLFFLDYMATGQLELETGEEIITGITRGCKQAGVALLGGETAEMPGFYQQGSYDLAGFAVGIVDRKNIITGSKIKAGDQLLGLPSSGIHSNGYSLVRKVLLEKEGLKVDDRIKELDCTLGEELLKPTRIYVPVVLPLLEKYEVKGIAHITGGGMPENIARIIPDGLQARVNRESWSCPPVFTYIQAKGDIATVEMERTFNMGIGMVLVVSPDILENVMSDIKARGEKVYHIGEINSIGKKEGKVVIYNGQ
ncbi:phosphoribosylformylglycinamidine cyclo-ligase [Halothermothrix orenii]|uniref:Phosphoribosylformylglycinamidine cyclo-ligase n=1 Tax=Halothermothrix orenii (strain H 168 / OCM 544 / DSM 9562) TaxID=373903 RepID=B8D0M0_HALOH|nr:phosphoribosylformylglycinamidine cyclo-ligase [Halothermothrix orenii]ACL70956.1 phosphoribosylformylglycinamidine cyclo-ligase [Halothermothrix orenii H 168]